MCYHFYYHHRCCINDTEGVSDEVCGVSVRLLPDPHDKNQYNSIWDADKTDEVLNSNIELTHDELHVGNLISMRMQRMEICEMEASVANNSSELLLDAKRTDRR